MIDGLLTAFGKYKWLVVVYVIFTVVFCAYLYTRTEEFSWNKKNVRAFAILYNLDKRGRVCLIIMLSRLVLLCYLAVTGGSGSIWELAAIEIMSIVYAIVSGDSKDYLQIMTYLAIYILLLMENMLFAYNRDIESSFLAVAVAVAIGLFATLYSVHQALTGYDRLLNVCFERVKKRYKGIEDSGTRVSESQTEASERSDTGVETS